MARANKYNINTCIPASYLFDGYLTERASYPQLQVKPYLTDAPDKQLLNALIPCASAVLLFDGYLTVGK